MELSTNLMICYNTEEWFLSESIASKINVTRADNEKTLKKQSLQQNRFKSKII